ncbi:hypothetical protein OSTOST_14403 [Ostertagia ostertagi]
MEKEGPPGVDVEQPPPAQPKHDATQPVADPLADSGDDDDDDDVEVTIGVIPPVNVQYSLFKKLAFSSSSPEDKISGLFQYKRILILGLGRPPPLMGRDFDPLLKREPSDFDESEDDRRRHKRRSRSRSPSKRDSR